MLSDCVLDRCRSLAAAWQLCHSATTVFAHPRSTMKRDRDVIDSDSDTDRPRLLRRMTHHIDSQTSHHTDGDDGAAYQALYDEPDFGLMSEDEDILDDQVLETFATEAMLGTMTHVTGMSMTDEEVALFGSDSDIEIVGDGTVAADPAADIANDSESESGSQTLGSQTPDADADLEEGVPRCCHASCPPWRCRSWRDDDSTSFEGTWSYSYGPDGDHVSDDSSDAPPSPSEPEAEPSPGPEWTES